MQFKDSSRRLFWDSHFLGFLPPISDGPLLYGTDRPGAGGRVEIFLSFQELFSRKTFLPWCFRVLHIVWDTVKPDSRQCEKCPFCPQFCQFLVWLGFVIVTKTKPNLNCAKNGGNMVVFSEMDIKPCITNSLPSSRHRHQSRTTILKPARNSSS